MKKTIAIDEEGFFKFNEGLRLSDEDVGQQMLEALSIDDAGVIHLDHEGEDILVEAFDKPYVARQVHFENDKLIVQMPYQLKCEVQWDSLCLDEWDRFHGKTISGIPFVMSRPAQAELFNLADDFTDETITIGSHTITTPPYFVPRSEVNDSKFWTEIYESEKQPPWDLNEAHPELKSALSQLKVYRSRILVPGCGYGHDAAFLAQKGHLVTAVDISDTAIEKAKELYGHIENLSFLKADIFNLGENYHECFDLIFEHTCYCAIEPHKRNDLVKAWQRYLVDTGHLLGIFFVVPKRTGPYFGGSEWELRERLQRRFQFRYWTRLHHSPGWRLGSELMIYAQIRS